MNDLEAAAIYHDGQAQVAEVYGRLHGDADCRKTWQLTRNRHIEFAEAIRKAAHSLETTGVPAGLRHAIEEAIHVLEIERTDPGVKSCDVSLALIWLKNGLAGLYDRGPNGQRSRQEEA